LDEFQAKPEGRGRRRRDNPNIAGMPIAAFLTAQRAVNRGEGLVRHSTQFGQNEQSKQAAY
jgi:hypothetical protein